MEVNRDGEQNILAFVKIGYGYEGVNRRNRTERTSRTYIASKSGNFYLNWNHDTSEKTEKV
jgi:hypothetical protein